MMKNIYTAFIFALVLFGVNRAAIASDQQIRKLPEEDVNFLKQLSKYEQLAVGLAYTYADLMNPAKPLNEVRSEVFNWVRENMPHVDHPLMRKVEAENDLRQRFNVFAQNYAAKVNRYFGDQEESSDDR
jgi:hypothetical protein